MQAVERRLVPYRHVVQAAIGARANRKTNRCDGLPADFLKLRAHERKSGTLGTLYEIIAAVCDGAGEPQERKDATPKALQRKCRVEGGNHQSISLVAHDGEELLKVIPGRLRNYNERKVCFCRMDSVALEPCP